MYFYDDKLTWHFKQTQIKPSYRCDLGLDALPEGPGVVLVLGGQSVPHPDHVVTDAQRQTPCAHGGEGQGVDETAQGGQGPAAVQRGQVPAFNLDDNKSGRLLSRIYHTAVQAGLKLL